MSSFWDRRRAAVAKEAEAEEAAKEAERLQEHEAAQAEKSDDELLEELGLPDPDTLDDENAFKAFLADGVPNRLKTRALRRLWRLNPVLANVDGLVEYGEDYTDAAMVVENLQTAYQVGKGMLSHLEELARKAEAAANEAEAPAEEAPEEDDDPDEAVLVELNAEEASEPVHIPAPEPEVAQASRRRMTFTYEDQRTG